MLLGKFTHRSVQTNKLGKCCQKVSWLSAHETILLPGELRKLSEVDSELFKIESY